ncbi:MAG: BREX system P-loop protein BrxC [Stellaceae bacterium]
MLNREVFHTDPEKYSIANQGVAKILFPPESGLVTETLRGELQTFVTDGEYGRGLIRILEAFLAALGRGDQGAVWISGFYGSGKSHLAKMLGALWTDFEFPDGARASGLVPEISEDLRAALRSLRAAAARAGGLHCAGGGLDDGSDNPILTTLRLALLSVGLPDDFRAARVAFWLADEGVLDAVRERLADGFDSAIRNFVLSRPFHEAVLSERPDLGNSPRDLSDRLKANFPQPTEITVADLSSMIRRALLFNRKELPLTLIVLDETQEFLKYHSDQTGTVRSIAERLGTDFDGRLLLVCTGQQALTDVDNLQRLLGRFPVRVSLGEADMDAVIRKTVLRKSANGRDAVRAMLGAHAGEISRQIHGSRLAHRQEDAEDAILDWPLLPSRRRVWERILRALDRTGLLGTLRKQMAVALAAARLMADRPLGHAVPADFLYSRFAEEAFSAGELPEETRARIIRLREGGPPEKLQARVLMLVYMLGLIQRDADAHGVRPTAETIADLLIEDLGNGAGLRGEVPKAIAALAEAGAIIEISGVWQLQTKESAEWDRLYRAEERTLDSRTTDIARERNLALDAALATALKDLPPLTQGRSNVGRRLARLRQGDKAPADAVPAWIYNGWQSDLEAVEREIAALPATDPGVHVLIPIEEREALEAVLRQRLAAQAVLDQQGAPQTIEGQQAQQAMETRRSTAQRNIAAIAERAVAKARVLQADGAVISGSLKNALQTAAQNSLIRLYPQFDQADHPGWANVVTRAQAGQPDALQSVDHNGPAETHPVCHAIRQALGAGRRGAELRSTFEASPFGWSRDAIDGALLVLDNADLIRSIGEDGQETTLRSLTRNRWGAVRFVPETHTPTQAQRRSVRGLAQAVKLNPQPNEEAEVIPQLLERLENAVAASGGPPPAPAPAEAPALAAFRGLSGNERLIEIASRAKELQAQLAEWRRAAELIAARMPAFRLVERLVELGAAGQAAALADIRERRRLLEEPDPLPPLRQDAAAELRTRLNAAVDAYQQACQEGEQRLADDADWQRLTPDERHTLRAEAGLLRIERPGVSTPEEIAAALTARNLGQWQIIAKAMPQCVAEALAEAAEKFTPEVKQIRLPAPKVLPDLAALDAWIAEVRAALVAALVDGPVRPRI